MKKKNFHVISWVLLVLIFASMETQILGAPGKRTYKGNEDIAVSSQTDNDTVPVLEEDKGEEIPALVSGESDEKESVEELNQPREEVASSESPKIQIRPEQLITVIQKQAKPRTQQKSEQIASSIAGKPVYYEISHSHIKINEEYTMKQ